MTLVIQHRLELPQIGQARELGLQSLINEMGGPIYSWAKPVTSNLKVDRHVLVELAGGHLIGQASLRQLGLLLLGLGFLGPRTIDTYQEIYEKQRKWMTNTFSSSLFFILKLDLGVGVS